MDARVGGEYEFEFYSASKEVGSSARGRIVELVPDRKLVLTFASSREAPGAPPSLVTWTLEEGPDGKTRVTLVHSGIGAASFSLFLGWGYYLTRLTEHCSRMPVRN